MRSRFLSRMFAYPFDGPKADETEVSAAYVHALPAASGLVGSLLRSLIRLAAPMAPHLAEESWAALGESGMVVDAAWPEFDPAMLVDEEVTLAVQERAVNSNEEHRKIVEALKQHDGARAEELADAHMRNTINNMDHYGWDNLLKQ